MQAVLPADEYPAVEYTGTDSRVDAIYKAGDKGYVVQCTVGGSQGTITMVTGVANDGTVTGISVLDHGETPGLGAIAGAAGEKGDAFRGQFAGLTSAAVTKDGGSVEALTGATVTSRAICAGVNAALDAVKTVG
jgi:electron transport complex protein RnfG